MSSDETFKEWMRQELGEMKNHLTRLDQRVMANTQTLNRYLWMWRAVRWSFGSMALIVATNWESFIKFVMAKGA